MTRLKLILAAGIIALLSVGAWAQDREKNIQLPTNAYFFREIVQFLMTTPPDRLIKDNASFVNTRQRETMSKKDDVLFDKGLYQLFVFKNLGKMKVEWTGRTDQKKTKVMVAYWDGKVFSPKEFAANDAIKSRAVVVNQPPTEDSVYVLVYCPDGAILTDAITAELISDTDKPGL